MGAQQPESATEAIRMIATAKHIEETLYHNQLVPSADSVRERADQDPQLPRRVPLGAQSLLWSFIGSESASVCVCACAMVVCDGGACVWRGMMKQFSLPPSFAMKDIGLTTVVSLTAAQTTES
eukprot:TRINITY_DN6865_c0_g1_i6.p3 TRINITY_DN6865_c0_g1~~TRINITY_DN6865_c0_g1_i6.p3  ORF type:complete len:123 (-),score=8.18 TRINITY_DN6865_c0_g1_i6:488-856(-)